jgi:hypothetical protein
MKKIKTILTRKNPEIATMAARILLGQKPAAGTVAASGTAAARTCLEK